MINYFTKHNSNAVSGKYDWSKIVTRISLNVEWPKIYRAWATQQGLEKWFLREAKFINTFNSKRKKTEFTHTGDKYDWYWFGNTDNSTGIGQVLEANGTDTLRFTFTGGTIVSVQLKSEDTWSVVELCQELIGANENSKAHFYIHCLNKWNFYLTNLKSVLEGGLDLRNKNERIKQLINC